MIRPSLFFVFITLFFPHIARSDYVWHANTTVDPTLTDSSITRNFLGPGFGDHSVFWRADVGSCSDTGGCGLFVMLSGSYGQPRFTRYIQNTAADVGFHSIGLAYSNADAYQNICSGLSGLDSQNCQYFSRVEDITGQNVSSYKSTSVADSIENRLLKLLLYLDNQYPDLGWSRYFSEDENDIAWSKITIAGHSQGAGTSQITSMLHPVHRVIKFAGGVFLSPGSFDVFDQVTADAFYSFIHTQDDLYTGVLSLDYVTLDLNSFGSVVNVDNATEPYNGTHVLSTSLNTSNAHGAVVSDTSLSFEADGTPIYDGVWKFLLSTPSHDSANSTTSSSSDQQGDGCARLNSFWESLF